MAHNSNIQKETQDILCALEERGEKPSLLLHSCCAPCSSYTLECLTAYFHVDVFYFNPNIAPQEEYVRRLSEQKRLLAQMPLPEAVGCIEGEYDPEAFTAIARGKESQSEGGERCFACYALRLAETARLAKAGGYDFFTTTLSISPHKNAAALDALGKEIAARAGVAYLPLDLKKRGGYQRSIELSAQYGLYRQDYCGCIYSQEQARQRRLGKAQERETELG